MIFSKFKYIKRDNKERRKQYFVDNRDRALEKSNNNIILNLDNICYMSVYGYQTMFGKISVTWHSTSILSRLQGIMKTISTRPGSAAVQCIRLRLFSASSNKSWAYTGETFISASASKFCLLRSLTTTCEGTDHGLTYKNKYIYQKCLNPSR
jgi:hypothetical protein